MIVRISFENGQKVNKKQLEQLEKDLADNVETSQLYKKEDGYIGTIYLYSESDNPEDEDVKAGKKKLVFPIDSYEINSNKEYLADIEFFLSKHPELKIKLRGTPPTFIQDYSSMIKEIIAIQEKFENALKSFDQKVEFNQKCDVHVANLGLLNINQLGYAVDYCTESLQEVMNSGWRIIACCVQPDGRRPDYILGRNNPDSTKLECVKF
jgi:hypothetical protein